MNTNLLLSMNTDMKTLRLQNEWQQRLASGDMTTKRNLYAPPSAETDDEKEQGKLQQIHTKMQYGGKLTESERKYLKSKDPNAYAELVREEEEQKNFERALRLCRTKDDVLRLKFSRISRSLSAIKEAERDSSLTSEEKLRVASREMRTINHTIKSTNEYLRTANLTKSSRSSGPDDLHRITEEHLRSLLKDRVEQLINRSSVRTPSRFDTFLPSDRTSDENESEATRLVKDLYEIVQKNWGKTTTNTSANTRV